MSVRLATRGDYDVFKRLCGSALHEAHSLGYSTMLPTARSLQHYLGYFTSYTSGSLFGTCVLWSPDEGGEPVGFVMAGEPWEPTAWDSTLGRVAHLWELYVDMGWRKRRVTLEMLKLGVQVMRDAGFDTVSYNAPPGERGDIIALADSATPRGVWYTVDLRVRRSYEEP